MLFIKGTPLLYYVVTTYYFVNFYIPISNRSHSQPGRLPSRASHLNCNMHCNALQECQRFIAINWTSLRHVICDIAGCTWLYMYPYSCMYMADTFHASAIAIVRTIAAPHFPYLCLSTHCLLLLLLLLLSLLLLLFLQAV